MKSCSYIELGLPVLGVIQIGNTVTVYPKIFTETLQDFKRKTLLVYMYIQKRNK